MVTSDSYAARRLSGAVYCASRAGSKVMESLMSIPSTSVPLLLAACTLSGSPAASAAPPIPSRRTTLRRPIQPISRTFVSLGLSSHLDHNGTVGPYNLPTYAWRQADHAVCGTREDLDGCCATSLRVLC